MNGLMMDVGLTVPALLQRAETLHARKEIVTRLPDRSIHRYTYGQMIERARRLTVALRDLGVRPGDRVGTFCWNHYRHLEAYFGAPMLGAVLHTLNLRLHPDELTFVINHAGDRVVIVDDVLWPAFERFRERIHAEHIVVVSDGEDLPPGTLSYEDLLAGADPALFQEADIDENQAAATCYTTGTTGKPKGVLYSHRALVLHSLVAALPDVTGLREADVVLPVVPMFHANAWGLPYTATLVGAAQVLPGPFLDPASLLELLRDERVTFTAGVPTVWMGILSALDAAPGAHDLSSLRHMLVGGSAAPEAMIRGFEERHGLHVLHAWGMTEMAPLGTFGHLTAELRERSPDEQFRYRAKQGRPVPFIEVRARGDDGLVPWDGATMGELEVRGPWVARSYFNNQDAAVSFTDDGWFRTGDIVTIDERGYVELQDRAKDLVKSGGEWISSVALENALMSHPSVAEAAVIPVPHERWGERPLAVVVLKAGRDATPGELRDFLAPLVARWWIPDDVVFVDEIPRTSVGKFLKSALRQQYAGNYQNQGGTSAG